MTLSDLQRALDAGKIPPLLLLHGEETYLLERALKQVIDAVIPADARDFNLNVVPGRDVKGPQIIDLIRTFPVFARHRLVLIRDIHQTPAAELEVLVPYLSRPLPETVFVVTGDKIDLRRKFFSEFKKHGELIEFKKLFDNQFPAAVRDLARELKITLTEDALALFCRRVTVSLQEASVELGKLSLYLGERHLADVADVDAVISSTRQETIFALNDAIGDRQGVKAVQLCSEILADGTAGLVVLSMLTRHLRNLYRLHELQRQNAPRGELAKAVGVNPYFLDGLLRQAQKYSPEQMPAVFTVLLETDLALKSSGAHPEALLEQAVLKICALK